MKELIGDLNNIAFDSIEEYIAHLGDRYGLDFVHDNLKIIMRIYQLSRCLVYRDDLYARLRKGSL